MIVLMAGLPGTGKTTLARELAARTSGRIISKDEIRHALFAENEIEYSTSQDDFRMQIMLQLASQFIETNHDRIIFLDGRTFSRNYQIENVIHAAESLHQPWRILQCVCADEIIRKRLEEQSLSAAHPAANRTFQLYLDVQSRFEAITRPKNIIDTAQPPDVCLNLALQALGVSLVLAPAKQ